MSRRSAIAATSFGLGLAVSAFLVAQSAADPEEVSTDAAEVAVSSPEAPSPTDLRAALRAPDFLPDGWMLLAEGRVATMTAGTSSDGRDDDVGVYETIPSELDQWKQDRLAEMADQPPEDEGIDGDAFLYGPADARSPGRLAIKVYAKGIDVALPSGARAFETATELVHVIPISADAPLADAIVEGLVR